MAGKSSAAVVSTTAEPWPADRPIPSIVNDTELRQILNVSAATFYRRKALGQYRMFIVTPQLPGPTQYSGAKVDAWRKGVFTHAQVFGARSRAR